MLIPYMLHLSELWNYPGDNAINSVIDFLHIVAQFLFASFSWPFAFDHPLFRMFLIFLFERQKERKRKLVYSPRAHNDWGWARLFEEARSFKVAGGDATTWAISCCPHGDTLARSWSQDSNPSMKICDVDIPSCILIARPNVHLIFVLYMTGS